MIEAQSRGFTHARGKAVGGRLPRAAVFGNNSLRHEMVQPFEIL